jgi:GT2 family glycosyltransferase
MTELMGERPELSVIIPCYQAAGELPLQLTALATQESPPSFEVLIVDNRSTDQLHAVVDAKRANLLASGATDVRLLEAHDEAGASYARNVGARHARSDRLVFCDADDCVSAYWLSDAIALFELADSFSGSALPILDSEFGDDVAALRSRIEPAAPPVPTVRPQEDLAIPIVMGGDFGIRRGLFLELDGFDQSLPTAGEDNDLAYRLRAAGHSILDSPAMRVAYRIRDRGTSRRAVARKSALAHVLLCERYGVFKSSAYVGRGRLALSTAKLAVAAIKMLLTPGQGDVEGLLTRAAGIEGFWRGIVRYRYLRRIPPARLGIGLAHADRG